MERTSPRSNLYQDIEEKIEDTVSGKLMTKAVTVVPCGHILNEDTVTQSLAHNRLCPLDGQPINTYVPNYTIRRLAKLDPPLVQGFRVLFRKQEGTSWFVIIRESSGCIKGVVLQKENRLHPIDIQGIPSTLKLEDLDRVRAFLADSRFRLTDRQIEVLPRLRGGVKQSKSLCKAATIKTSSVDSTKRFYSKLLIIVGKDTITFHAHEIAKIVVDLLASERGHPCVVEKIGEQNSKIDEHLAWLPEELLKNDNIDLNAFLIPAATGNMVTPQNWLYVARNFNASNNTEKVLRKWLIIADRLIGFQVQGRWAHYASDHGLIEDIAQLTGKGILSFEKHSTCLEQADQYIIKVFAKKQRELIEKDQNFIRSVIDIYPEFSHNKRRAVINIHTLASISKEVNSGVQESLLRPDISYADGEKGPAYHKFAQSISDHLSIQGVLNDQELAKKIRLILKDERSENIPSFLPSLTAALFISEVSRNPVSILTGLMLLDLIENAIEIDSQFLYSWQEALIHPLDKEGQDEQGKKISCNKATDAYGQPKHPFDVGGFHPMSHNGAVDELNHEQKNNTLGNSNNKNRQPLSVVRQKEASLTLHWLCEYINRNKDPNGQSLKAELCNGKPDLQPLFLQNVEELEGEITKHENEKTNLKEGSKDYKKSQSKISSLKEIKNRLLKSENYSQKLEVCNKFIKPILLRRLSTADDLLNSSSGSKVYGIPDQVRNLIDFQKFSEEEKIKVEAAQQYLWDRGLILQNVPKEENSYAFAFLASYYHEFKDRSLLPKIDSNIPEGKHVMQVRKLFDEDEHNTSRAVNLHAMLPKMKENRKQSRANSIKQDPRKAAYLPEEVSDRYMLHKSLEVSIREIIVSYESNTQELKINDTLTSKENDPSLSPYVCLVGIGEYFMYAIQRSGAFSSASSNKLLEERKTIAQDRPVKQTAPATQVQKTSSLVSTKIPQKALFVSDLNLEPKKLTLTYETLRKKVERGIARLSELLTFQDRLIKASSMVEIQKSFEEMQEGIEVMIAAVLSESSVAGLGTPQMHSTTSYEYRGDHYYPRATSAHNNACAIHAVLGETMENVYRYNGDPKKHYTDILIAAIGTPIENRSSVQNRALEAYSDSMRNYLTGEDPGAVMLFGSEKGRKFKQQWKDISTISRDEGKTPSFNNQLELYRLQEGRLWLPLIEQPSSPYLNLIMDDVEAVKDPISRWYKKNREEVLEVLQRHPELIVGFVDQQKDPNPFIKLLESSYDLKSAIELERKRRQEILKELYKTQDDFIFSKEMIENYIATVNTRAFFLDTNDLKVLANLFNKKVVVIEDLSLEQQAWNAQGKNSEIFGKRDIAIEEINLEHGEGDLIIVHHFGTHFSRCVKAESS